MNEMNQTIVNNFLKCLVQIDDLNYLALHARAAAINGISNGTTGATPILAGLSNDHDHDHDHDHDDDDHDHDHSTSADLLVAKITAMVVLCVATTVCGSIPFLLNRCFKWTENDANARSATVVKCLLYFGGGVLLSTTFLHLLPEVQEAVALLQECAIIPELQFALGELLMCVGFFLMYLIEEVIHAYIHRHKRLLQLDEGAAAAFERGHSVRNSYLVKGNRPSQSSGSATVPTAPTMSAVVDDDMALEGLGGGPAKGTLSVQDLISNDVENQKYQEQTKLPSKSVQEYDIPNNQNNHRTAHHPHSHPHHQHTHHHHDDREQHHSHLPTGVDDDMVTSSLRGLFIVLALSLHELFEGMAIGLESSASSVWFMFGAVSAHKLVLAFCVGVELIVARTRTGLSVIYVLTFAIVSPIGIGIGILISHTEDTTAPSIPSAILQGLACGTLLYVVFFEILSKNHAGLGAYLALFVGFAVMFGLQQLGSDEHGHSHGSCGGGSSTIADHSGGDKALLLQAAGDGHSHPHSHAHGHHHHHLSSDEPTTVMQSSFEQQLQILRQASQSLLHNSKKTD